MAVALGSSAQASPRRVVVVLESALAAPDGGGASLALRPDVWIALDDRVTLGLTSSGAARGRLVPDHGVCVHGCVDRLGGVALDARVALGASPWRGVVALHARRLAPTPVALELGVQRRWERGRITAQTAPRLELGLTRRDLDNDEVIHVPLTLSVMVARRISAGLSSGMRGKLTDAFFDTATMPSYLTVTFGAAQWQLDLRVGTDDARAARPVPTMTLGVAAAFGGGGAADSFQ